MKTGGTSDSLVPTRHISLPIKMEVKSTALQPNVEYKTATLSKKMTGQSTYNVTLGRVRAKIIAVEKAICST